VRTLLVGTTNPDKFREIRTMLAELPIELRSLVEFPGVSAADEPGPSYMDNARVKARYYARQTGLPTVAEDSGFEVDALGGEPGQYSARFLRPDATYVERFAELYRRVGGLGAAGTSVRFVCALVLATPDCVLFETRQTVEGVLAPEPRGAQGFGYDPIFLFPPFGRTFGEVGESDKSNVSHRGLAIRALRDVLRQAQPAAND
jgi:XTP/dITP diphosphohydrolase